MLQSSNGQSSKAGFTMVLHGDNGRASGICLHVLLSWFVNVLFTGCIMFCVVILCGSIPVRCLTEVGPVINDSCQVFNVCVLISVCG